MKQLHKITYLLISIIVLFSCNKATEDLDYERKVMSQIFPELLDSIYVGYLYIMAPPYAEEGYSGIKKWEDPQKDLAFKADVIKKFKEEMKERIEITVVISDTIHEIEKEGQEELIKHFDSIQLPERNIQEQIEYKIDLKEQKANEIFKLMSGTDFSRQGKWGRDTYYIWKEISFSRIQFDKSKRFGVLTCDYICGLMCGHGFTIFIRKVNDNWRVDSIISTWTP